MTTSEQQQVPSSQSIRDEVRRTIQRLSELAQTEDDFDQFCETVLAQVVKITGSYGCLFWQIKGNNSIELTHLSGSAPHETARQIVTKDNRQHTNALAEVVNRKLPMGLASETFTGPVDNTDPDRDNDAPFLMLFAPVNRAAEKCCGVLELVQRGDINPKAQEGYLRFLTQITQLFQRWFESKDLTRLSENADSWSQRMEFISQVHGSIDDEETAYAIANEARRLLGCDRVSVGKWNGRKCKISSISSQDRFDNRANVVRLLSNVATASVSADTQFWITGDTEGIAPEVAKIINEYLDESHSRTLAVIPLSAKQPEIDNLEMRSRRKEKAQKLGAILIEYFDADVPQEQIDSDVQLIVAQSQLALENSYKHGEIFLLPIWKRLGWLQKVLFKDHFAKTMTGLGVLAFLTLLLLFCPWQLKMKVDGVLHPSLRRTIHSKTEGIVKTIFVKERSKVKKGDPILELENRDLEIQISNAKSELETLTEDIKDGQAQLSSISLTSRERAELDGQIRQMEIRQQTLTNEMKLWELKRKYQIITSPIDGTVITSQLERRFQEAPVNPNLALVEIANLKGDWQVDIKIPQPKLGYVLAAFEEQNVETLDVEFKISTDPNLTLKGTLSRNDVENRAIPSDAGEAVVRGIVRMEKEELAKLENKLRSGAGTTVRVFCGTKSMGKAFFYQIFDFISMKLF